MGLTCCKRLRNNGFFLATSSRPKRHLASFFLCLGADVNSRDGRGETALIRMAIGEHYKCLKMLIKSGADVNSVDSIGWNALHWALFCYNPLYVAAEKRNTECIDLLLEASGGKLPESECWSIVLNKACFLGHETLTRLLIEAGANVNVKDNFHSPLSLAAFLENIECMKLLVEAGADVNIVDSLGNTPLMRASQWLQIKSMEVLIDSGADVNYSVSYRDYSNDNYTPLNAVASWCGVNKHWMSCAKLLLQTEVDVTHALREDTRDWLCDQLDEEGFMLLYAAGVSLDKTNQFLLMQNGADTLKNMCRERIRKYLLELSPTSLFFRIPQLGLPPLLTDYLLYNININDSSEELEKEKEVRKREIERIALSYYHDYARSLGLYDLI